MLRRCAPRPPRPIYEDGRSGTFSPSLRYGENVAYAGNVVRNIAAQIYRLSIGETADQGGLHGSKSSQNRSVL